MKGAVGTQASFVQLLDGTGMEPSEMETMAMRFLDLQPFEISSQTYSRRQDLQLVNRLAELASTLHKFALDFRLMQSPAIGEWSEPFGRSQVGSSAMPFKRNPILSENICSLARYVASLPSVAWENAAQSALERTLDDSANRRLFLPEAFLALDEILLKATRLVAGMVLDEAAVKRNLSHFGSFAATERLLMALVVAGADRQQAHEWIRQATLAAQQTIEKGEANSLSDLLVSDDRITRFLKPTDIESLLDASQYVGTAPNRAAIFAQKLRNALSV
jgi:adenylosuccinate lyase